MDLCFKFLHHPQRSSASCLLSAVCSWSQPSIWQRRQCCAGCDPYTCWPVNLSGQERSEDSWAHAAALEGREKVTSALSPVLIPCKDLIPLGPCLPVKCSWHYLSGSKILRARDRSETDWWTDRWAGNVITFISLGNRVCKSYAKWWIRCRWVGFSKAPKTQSSKFIYAPHLSLDKRRIRYLSNIKSLT